MGGQKLALELVPITLFEIGRKLSQFDTGQGVILGRRDITLLG